MGGVVKSVAKIAVPALATFALGPAGAGIFTAVGAGVAGGAIGGLVAGGGIKGALLGGLSGGVSAGLFKGAGTKLGNLFGGVSAGGGAATQTGQGFINQLAGRGPALSSFAQNVSTQGVGYSLAHLGQTTTAHSQPYAQSTLFHGGASPTFTGAGSKIGANLAAQERYLASTTLPGKEGLKTDVTTQAVGEDTILGLSKEDFDAYITGGFDLYKESLAQSEVEALEKNLEGFRPEYAKAYQEFAQRELDEVQAGELGPGFDQAMEDEAQRIERMLTASGHNVRDASAFARSGLQRGLGKLKASFLEEKRRSAIALAGGADTMQTRLEAQRQSLAQLAPQQDFEPLRDIASDITSDVFEGLV